MNKSTKKLVTGFLISIALIVLIGWKLSSENALASHLRHLQEHFDGDNYILIICIMLLAPMSWIIEGTKWRYLLKKIQRIPLFTAIASVLTGMSFALVTPGKVGDFAGRILYLDDNIRLRGAIAVLVGNFAHVVVTFFLGIIGLVFVLTQHSGWIEWTLFGTAITLGIVISLLFFNINKIQFKKRKKKNWVGKFFIALKILKRYNQKDLLRILGFSLLKLCTYTSQFVLVTYLFGSTLPFGIAFLTAAAMFWIIMIVPSFFIADVLVRGAAANLVFVETGIIQTGTPILAGTYIIWLINWVMPSIIGALVLLAYRFLNRGKVKEATSIED